MPQKPLYDLSEFGGTPIAPGTPPDTNQDASAIPPPALIKTADAPRVSGYDLSEFGGQPIKEPKSGYDLSQFGGVPISSGSLVGMATAKASQSWLGDTWDWLWTGRYNEAMDHLGAPDWMHYTGAAAKAVQEGIGGKTGAVVGGLVHGVEEALYSQSSVAGLALLIGTLGGSAMFESAGEAALVGAPRAIEAAEAGIAGAEGAEATAGAAKGASAIAKFFSKADFKSIQTGVDIMKKAEATGQNVEAALTEARINPKMFQDALNTLHRVGLGPTDVLNRGLIVNGGGQLLRSLGMGVTEANKLATAGQILLDAGFSANMLLGVGYNFPRIWEAAKTGNTEEAFRLASESSVFGLMGFMGLGAAKQHAGEVYGDILQKYGFNVKMDQSRIAMRDIGNMRGRMETEGVVTAKNLDAEISKKYKAAGLDEGALHSAKILAEGNLEIAKVRERYNLLCENASHPELKVLVPPEEAQQAGPAEYYMQQGDSVHIPPQQYFQKAFNVSTVEDAAAAVVRTPEDRAKVDEFKKRFMAGQPGVSSAILYDEKGNVIGAENPHQALAYLELEKDHPGLRMPVASKFRSDQNPIHTSVEEDRMAKYTNVAAQQLLTRAEAYGKDGVLKLLANYRNAIDPTPAVRELAQWTRTEFLKALEYAKENDVHIPAIEAYTTNMWDDAAKTNAAHEAFKHDLAHDSKLQLNATMLHKRTFANAFEGEMEGRKLKVTDPVKLVANYWATISKLVANRWALKAIQDKFIRTSDGMPVFVTAGTGRLVEGPNGENPSIFVDPRRIHDPDIAGKALDELLKSGHLERLIQEGKIIKIDDADREGPKKPMFANPPVALTVKAHIDKQLKEGTPVGATYNVALARMGKDPDMASSGMWSVNIYPEHGQLFDHPPTAAEIDAFAKNPVNQKLLFDVRNNLGIWRDDTGKYHMDISFLTKDFELAKSAGQTYNQMGIVQLDGKNFPFVSTGGDGTVPKTLPPGWEPENERTNALYLRHEVSLPEVHDSVKRNLATDVATAKGPQTLFQRTPRPVEPEKPVNAAPPDPKLPVLNAAAIVGGDVSTPATSYRDIEFGKGNGWVRRSAEPENSATPTNKGRTLMMQVSNDLINPHEAGAAPEAEQAYYDKLYQNRTGYARLHDFWEIPQWMGFASHFLPDADAYVIRDMAEAKAFLKSAGYDHVLFSSLDVNKDFIKELARDNPDQHFDVGGYATPGEFLEHKNVKWHNSMRSLADDMKVPYKEGVDYRHFQGSDVIPRLTMSQGCSYKCAFCTVPKQVTIASPMLVRQQIDAISKLRPKLVYLNDKTFGQATNYRDLADLNTKIRETNPDFKGFVVQTTAAQMAKFGKDPEWLHKSGIKFVELGIETYNDAILKDLHKPQSYAKFVEPAIAALAKEKIALIPNIMIGLPGEDAQTYQNTLDFLKRPDVQAITSHVNIYNLALYPDAELGKKMTTANPADLNENVTEKGYHGTQGFAPAEVHKTFSGDLYGVASKMLDKTPEGLATPDGDVSSMRGLDDPGRMKPEFNALDYLTKRGAELIATGASDFKTFANAIQNDVGETTIDPQHLQDLFRKANDYLTDARGRTTQGRAESAPPPFVSPEEWGSLNERGQLAYKVFSENLPSDAEYRAAAIVGQGGKDWYRRYTAGFQVLFPDPKDYNTFTRLFAALSPRKSIHTDLAQTLNVWAAWKEAGSPTDVASLTQLGQDNGVMGIQAEPGVKYKPSPNFLRALTSEEELHGPKVSAFEANLTGNFWRTTLDTWMQLFSGQKPEGFKPVGTAGHEQYLAIQSRIRSVAHDLGWTPEQAQAGVWSFVKTLVEIANPEGSPKVSFKEVLGLLTPEEFTARSKDLIDMVANDKEIQNALTRIGIDSSVIESAKRAAADVSKTAPGARQTEVPAPRTLASVADRLQEHRSELERNRLIHQEPPPLMGGRMVVPDDIAAGKKGTPQDGWITPAGQVRPRGTPGVKRDIDLDTGAIYYARGAKKSLGLQVQNLDPRTRAIVHSALLQMDAGRVTVYVHGTATRMDFPTKADALLRMSGEDTGHSSTYTLGRIDDEMKARAANTNERLFQKTEQPGAALDLATAGAKFLWDQPTTFNEWKELMQGAYGRQLAKLGGDPNVVLQDLYEQSLHRTLDIVKDTGVVPKGEPHIGYRPEILPATRQEIADAMAAIPGTTREQAIASITEAKQAKAGLQGKPHSLAVLNTNPVALLAAELADVEKATPYERKMRVERALKDAGYTGGYNSWDPGRVTVFGDYPVEAKELPLSHTLEQKLQDNWGYTKTQASASAAIFKGWAAMAGESYEHFVNSRFAGIETLKEGEEGARGMTEFIQNGQDAGKAVMYALKKGDFSTFIHEAGHVMRRGLAAGDHEILERTLGVKDGKWSVPNEEEFAQHLEAYMLEGKSPNKAMTGIFEKCKMWLQQVYLNMTGLPELAKTIKPELRGVFDRMFGQDAVNAEAPEPMTTQTARLQQAVADGGGQWVGVMEAGGKPEANLALFNVPDGPAKGATVSLPVGEATAENIRKAISEKQELFGAGLAKGPSVLYQENQKEPTVDDLQKEPKDKPRYVWNSHLYKTVPDSAFRNWNWAAYAPDGTKVMVNGELRVHPEMYDYVTRMFGLDESSLRKSPILGPILKVGSIAKQTLLSLSPFHIPQIGLRAIMSGVLPRVIKWDLKTDPQLARLVENSLELGQRYNMMEESQFQEGLMATGHKGLVSKVPVLRDYQNWLQKFTFERLLPSLKVLVAKQMDDRYTKMFQNQSVFEKFVTEHQDFQGLDRVRASARAAAIETNERLGMLNYKDMGRAAGTQDFLRLVTLAPDWLESEVRMVKRMFDPTGGKLLRRDMTYMVAGMWMTARVLNLMYTGQAHNEAPFGVAVQGSDGKEKIYSIRTLPTDMLHMAEDPDGFFKGRASPQVRALSEVVHGRDAFGRQLTPWQQTMDLTRNIMPIPLQSVGKIATGEMPSMTSGEQAMKAGGLTVTPFRDEAQKLASKLVSSRNEQGPVDPAELRKHQLMQEYEFQLHEGKLRNEDIYKMVEEGQISVQEAKRIVRTAHDTTGMEPELGRLYTQVSRLGMKDFMQVWAVMNDQEKAAAAILLTKKKAAYLKSALKSMTPAERKADPTYQWIRATFPQQAPWGEE